MALTGLALLDGLLLLWLALCVTLVVVGIGVLLVPGAFNATRVQASLQRRLALRWAGVRVEQNYAATSEHGTGLGAAWRRTYRMAGDSATWRDLLWLLVNPLVGPLMVALPAAAVVDGAWGLCMPFLWRDVVSHWDHSWFAFIPLVSQTTAVLAAVLGAVEIVLGLLLARVMIQLYGHWVRVVLGQPERTVLAGRVRHLTTSRSDVVNQQAAELSRIERDLHDGAQARLVAMGMTISAAESLLERNPEAVRALLAEAKNSSATALRELRDLVRGIVPPVLADRGLVDAVRALALQAPVPVEVQASVPGPFPMPVESAVYFAVSELLNNVAKHAMARRANVSLVYSDGVLRVTVHDDGVGGVDPQQGSGIRGIERRLAAFDGFVSVFSHVGGPTDIVIEVPCQQLVSEDANHSR